MSRHQLCQVISAAAAEWSLVYRSLGSLVGRPVGVDDSRVHGNNLGGMLVAIEHLAVALKAAWITGSNRLKDTVGEFGEARNAMRSGTCYHNFSL